MKAVLKIEAIGDNTDKLIELSLKRTDDCYDGLGSFLFGDWPKRYGAYLVDNDGMHELKGKTDYSTANSVGSRGVYRYYTIESGKYYFVISPKSWRKSDRYFCTVNNEGDILRMTENEVIECLKNT